jgi:hypothetical protein
MVRTLSDLIKEYKSLVMAGEVLMSKPFDEWLVSRLNEYEAREEKIREFLKKKV